MTLKQFLGATSGDFSFIEEMKENRYEDLYEEVMSILNSSDKDNISEAEKKVKKVKSKYEKSLHLISEKTLEKVEVNTTSVQLKQRALARFFSKNPVKFWETSYESYKDGGVEMRNDNGNYSMIINGEEIAITKEVYDKIGFVSDEVEIYSEESIQVDDECRLVRRASDSIEFFLESENSFFPKILINCILDEDLKNSLTEEVKPKEKSQPKEKAQPKKTRKVEVVVQDEEDDEFADVGDLDI